MTKVVTVSGWIWKCNGRSLHRIGSLREPLQSVSCGYHVEMFLERKRNVVEFSFTMMLNITMQVCPYLPLALSSQIALQFDLRLQCYLMVFGFLLKLIQPPVFCAPRSTQSSTVTKKDITAKLTIVLKMSLFDWQALAQIERGSLCLRYLLAVMRSSDIKSLASLVTFSKHSLSNSHWPRRMLFMVSASLSPRKGERPLRLESNRKPLDVLSLCIHAL